MKPLTGAGTAAKRNTQGNKPTKEELLTSSDDEARELCRLAQQIEALAPWEWMAETDVFGVQDPVTNEIGFVSVMGGLGEYAAIAVYRGPEGLQGWLNFEAALDLDPGLADAGRLLLEIPHLHLSFADPDMFEKRDRDLLKGVGLKFSGNRPLFRSSRPGYFPWFVTREEARLLIHALSQAIVVTQRLAEDPNIITFEEEGEDVSILVRVSREQGSELIWEDRAQKISPPRPQVVALAIETGVLNKLKRLAQNQGEMETDLFMAPGAVGKRGDRPAALYTLLLADHESGIIFGVEAMAAEQGLAAMYADVANRLARLLLQAQFLPKRLLIRSDRLLELLTPLARQFNVELIYTDELPVIEEAANFIFEQMAGE